MAKTKTSRMPNLSHVNRAKVRKAATWEELPPQARKASDDTEKCLALRWTTSLSASSTLKSAWLRVLELRRRHERALKEKSA